MTVITLAHNRDQEIDEYVEGLSEKVYPDERSKWVAYSDAKRWFNQAFPGSSCREYDNFIKKILAALEA